MADPLTPTWRFNQGKMAGNVADGETVVCCAWMIYAKLESLDAALARIIHEQSAASTLSTAGTNRNACPPLHGMFNTASPADKHSDPSWQRSTRSRDEGS